MQLGLRTDMHPDTLYEIVLNTFARGLILSSRDSNFRNNIHDLAGDELTGDLEVLAYTIDQENTNFRNTLKTSIDSITTNYSSGLSDEYRLSSDRYSNDLDTIDMILDGFAYDSYTFFPQVYIPFYDSVNLHQDPVIAVVSVDSSIIWGYQKDQYSDAYNIIEINETFAKNNLVWVIDVNEQLETTDQLDTLLAGGPHEDTDTLRARSPNCADYNIQQVLITLHLEKWHGGRNCVAIQGFTASESNGAAIHGINRPKLTKISKYRLNEWRDVDWRYRYLTEKNLPQFCEGSSLDFIIYERDPQRRKFKKQVYLNYDNDCNLEMTKKIVYYSRQTPFFLRTYPVCSRSYSDLGNSSWDLDLIYNYSGFNGSAKLYYGK